MADWIEENEVTVKCPHCKMEPTASFFRVHLRRCSRQHASACGRESRFLVCPYNPSHHLKAEDHHMKEEELLFNHILSCPDAKSSISRASTCVASNASTSFEPTARDDLAQQGHIWEASDGDKRDKVNPSLIGSTNLDSLLNKALEDPFQPIDPWARSRLTPAERDTLDGSIAQYQRNKLKEERKKFQNDS